MEHVVLLRGNVNWAIWKFRTQVLLTSKNIYEVCSNYCKPVMNEQLQKGEFEKSLREWTAKDRQAQEIIVSRLEESQMLYIMTCDTAYGMWNKLIAVFEKKSEVSLHVVQQKFFGYKYEGQSISAHVAKLEELVNQMKQLGENISEKMLITKILMSLPVCYSHFTAAWESTSVDRQNLNELLSRLLIEEERLLDKENKSEKVKPDENRALSAVKQFSRLKCFSCGKVGHVKKDCFKNRNVTENRPTCHYCKRFGHLMKDCRFKKQKDEKFKKDSNSAHVHAFTSMALLSGVDKEAWYMDSGASEHMTCNKEWFSLLSEYKRSVKISDGTLIEAEGIGDISIEVFDGCDWKQSVLRGVLYVPTIKVNLFSVGSAVDKGHKVEVDEIGCKIVDEYGTVNAMAYREGKLFKMMLRLVTSSACLSIEGDNLITWHQKLAHQNFNQIRKILKCHQVNVETKDNPFCEACVEGKQHRMPFGLSTTNTKEVCELIHVDLCGPMEVTSIGGSRYFLLLKDDYSHYRTVYFLKDKTEVPRKIRLFLKTAKQETGKVVKILRSDNGTEICNKEVDMVLEEFGIRHQTTVAYTPEQNGKAEREIRTIVEAARTMIKAKTMGKAFWAEAVNTATYVINRTGTSGIEGKSPYELWIDRKVDLRDFKIFGCDVYVHVPKQKRLKWDSKTRKGCFVGYGENTKGYRVYFCDSGTVECVRDVIFAPECNIKPILGPEEIQGDDSMVQNMQGSEEDKGRLLAGIKLEEPIVERYNLRNRDQIKPPERFSDFEMGFIGIEEPQTYNEAMECQNAENWRRAIEAELEVLKENNVWTEVELPENCKPIDCKWVFKIKYNRDENQPQYKARLVAKGFQQIEKFDTSEIYAPVVKLSTVRILLAVACQLNLKIHQMDVKSAFLYGEIDEEVFMHKPEGVEDEMVNHNNVWKLNRSIYGLKKSPRYWNEKFNCLMTQLGFKRSGNDYCLYVKVDNTNRLYVSLYVDDILIVGTCEELVTKLKGILSQNFKMKDIGGVSNYLGIEILQDIDSGRISLNQTAYLKQVLKNFKMDECRPVSVPMDPIGKIDQFIRKSSESSEIERNCRQLIGCLMYAMLGTRPDLCASVGFLSRYQNCASNELWMALKRVLRYVRGTLNVGLEYQQSTDVSVIEGFVDSDWGGDLSDRKSTSGYVFKVFNSSVSWCSRKQPTVAISSTEAEYMALSLATSEACWLSGVLTDLNVGPSNPVRIYEDNQSAIKIAKNPEYHKRLKHVDIRHHFVREKVAEGVIELSYLNTKDQIADVFTKPLNKSNFEKCCLKLGLKICKELF